MSFFFQVVVVCFMALLQFGRRLVLTACLWLVLQDQNVLRAQSCVSGRKGQCIKHLTLATVSSDHYYVRKHWSLKPHHHQEITMSACYLPKAIVELEMFSISKFL
jgi:hypothetical protein